MATKFFPLSQNAAGEKFYGMDREQGGKPILLAVATDGHPTASCDGYPLGTGPVSTAIYRDWAAYLWGMLPALGGAE